MLKEYGLALELSLKRLKKKREEEKRRDIDGGGGCRGGGWERATGEGGERGRGRRSRRDGAAGVGTHDRYGSRSHCTSMGTH